MAGDSYNKTENVVMKLLELPYSSNFYTFEINRALVNLDLTESMGGSRLNWAQGIKIKVTLLGFYVTLPQSVYIPFWKLSQIKRIMNGRHFTVLHVTDSKGNLKSLVILENWPESNTEPPKITGYQYAPGQASGLYPVST